MPARQRDRRMVGVTHRPACIDIRVPAHRRPTPRFCFRIPRHHPMVTNDAQNVPIARADPDRLAAGAEDLGDPVRLATSAADWLVAEDVRWFELPSPAWARRTIRPGGPKAPHCGRRVRWPWDEVPRAHPRGLADFGRAARRASRACATVVAPPGTAATNHSRSSCPHRKRSFAVGVFTSRSRCRSCRLHLQHGRIELTLRAECGRAARSAGRGCRRAYRARSRSAGDSAARYLDERSGTARPCGRTDSRSFWNS